MNLKKKIQKTLEQKKSNNLYRSLKTHKNFKLNFSSNDYLSLKNHPEIVQASKLALENFGTSSSSSRLFSGTFDLHTELEKKLAEFFRRESALVYGAGYLSNIGLISSLVSRDDVVVLDRLAHASLVDGAVLSRASIKRFRHNDLEHLEEVLVGLRENRTSSSNIFVVTESVFSMDGDLAPLDEIVELCRRFDSNLIIDEAHAFGVFGDGGRGVCGGVDFGDLNVFVTGTMSKAFVGYGGVALVEKETKEYLVNTSRAFIYNTALSPANVASVLASLRVIQEHSSLGEELQKKAEFFRSRLDDEGVEVMNSESQIVPVLSLIHI